MEYLAAIVFALLGLIEFALRVVLVLPLLILALVSDNSVPDMARETLTPFLWRLAEESITTERR